MKRCMHSRERGGRCACMHVGGWVGGWVARGTRKMLHHSERRNQCNAQWSSSVLSCRRRVLAGSEKFSFFCNIHIIWSIVLLLLLLNILAQNRKRHNCTENMKMWVLIKNRSD